MDVGVGVGVGVGVPTVKYCVNGFTPQSRTASACPFAMVLLKTSILVKQVCVMCLALSYSCQLAPSQE